MQDAKLVMISVVIPARDEEEFLPQCLESLKHQDYEGDYEIIVVDNGSTDNTGKVAQELGATVVVCPQRGVAYARQAGAYSARGDIIVQADADTIYPTGWLSRIARHFSAHPKSAALAGIYIYKDPPRWAKLEYFLRYLANMAALFVLGNAACISGANFAFRREAFLKVKGYDPHSLYPDQWGIAHRLSRVGKIAYDRRLSVSTSARRIQEPIYVILGKLLLNTIGVFRHFFKSNLDLVRTFTVKLPLLRTPARLGTATLLVGIISVVLYGYAAPSSQVYGKVYYKSKTPDKVIALTFDDGPNEPYTSEVLGIVKSYGIKATFFVVGKNVELYPDTAKRILAEGHVLENHSYSHNPNHVLTDEGYHDVKLAQGVISNIVGVTPHLYRPPHGRKSPWELYSLSREKLTEVTWSVAANDQHVIAYFGKPSPDMFAKEIIDKAKPGGIILLHDGYGTHHGDAKADRGLTVKALPTIIEELQRQGYRFVTVPELLNVPAYN